MNLICVTCLMIAVGCAEPQDGPSKEAVKKLAEELGEATLTGDYAKVIDHTYPGAVKEFGGREAGIAMIKQLMDQLKEAGIKFENYEVGEPGKFHTEGGNTFVVVPTRYELSSPQGRMRSSNAYLLGISSDGGKSWTFVDGAGMADEEFRRKVLPGLPEGLKLPEPGGPELIKDE